MMYSMASDPRQRILRNNFGNGPGGMFGGPSPTDTSRQGAVGATQARLGTSLADTFANAMMGYAGTEGSIMNGNFNGAANTRMAGNVNAINNVYDQNQGRIAAAGAGFGRSGNPATLNALDMNNMGRAGAVSGARGAMMENASQQYFNIINSGLGAGSGLLGNAANNFNKISDIQQQDSKMAFDQNPAMIGLGTATTLAGDALKGGGGG